MILAIDLGSTSFKAGVFDDRLRLMRSGSAPVRHHYASGGRVELGVADVERTLRRALPDTRGVTVITLTSQAQTFTVLDQRGRPTRPFVSWQDSRAGAAAARLKRRHPDFAEHCSFADVLPPLSVCQLHHAPARAGESFVLLPTYFVRQWTGEAVVDDNLAAMSGLYSLQLRAWWPAVVRRERLPRVIPVGTVAGVTTRNRYGLPVGLPVVLAGNDQTAGAYAARLEQTGAMLLTLGTAQVGYRWLRRLPPPRAGVVRGPYPGAGYYQLVADSAGASLVNWAETVLAGCETHDKFFAAAAQSPPGCHGLRFDADRGEWRNLGLHHTSADLARSILECASARLATRVATLNVPRRTPVLLAGGGGGRPVWRKILATTLGRRLRRTAADPLAGAARMAREQE